VNTREARALGKRIAQFAEAGETARAYDLLAPVLSQRTPFPRLGLIGQAVGAGPLETANALLDRIAAERTEGGWVIIGKALGQQLDRDLPGAFERCRAYIIAADVWYCTDILAERVPGPALVTDFGQALDLLTPWRENDSAWVRRAVGVAVHFWAKRSRGAEQLRSQAKALLSLLEPMFGEWEMDAVKGVGWGLKTLGRHYPDLVTHWLAREIVPAERRHRALMLRKALTYLSTEQRARAAGENM
jgi:3-methyladenine DNA glycosylase AlkD